MLLKHRYEDYEDEQYGLRSHVLKPQNRTLSPRRVCRSWKDAFDTTFKPHPGELRSALCSHHVQSVRYLIPRTKYEPDILYYTVIRNTWWIRCQRKVNTIFNIVLDLPGIDLDTLPLPIISTVKFPKVILHNGNLDQLTIFANHVKYKDKYTDILLKYHLRSDPVRFIYLQCDH